MLHSTWLAHCKSLSVPADDVALVSSVTSISSLCDMQDMESRYLNPWTAVPFLMVTPKPVFPYTLISPLGHLLV